jgi:hypothetical protein
LVKQGAEVKHAAVPQGALGVIEQRQHGGHQATTSVLQ